MNNNNQELLVYSDRNEKRITVKDKEEVKKIFGTRKKQTFLMLGLNSIDLNTNDLIMNFDVIESDDHLIRKTDITHPRDFFISQYVFRHLSQFLGLPAAIYDLIMDSRRLTQQERIEVLEHLGEILKIYFNHRLEEVKEGQKKDIFLTVFTDVFGSFARVIHSSIYYPYPDGEAFDVLEKGVELVNEQNVDRDYTFRSAEISPYESKFNYTNKLSKTATKPGDEIESGFTAVNSECKKASYNFQTYVLRLACMNGMTSRFSDNDLRVKHYESGFEQKITRAFVKALQLEDKFALKYIEATKYDQKISDDWADLLEIPSSILALGNSEKQELIELGRNKYGDFTPVNVLNTLTDKATHGSDNDNTAQRFNEKAIILMEKIADLDTWVPKNQQ